MEKDRLCGNGVPKSLADTIKQDLSENQARIADAVACATELLTKLHLTGRMTGETGMLKLSRQVPE